jgi:hypothetical protein
VILEIFIERIVKNASLVHARNFLPKLKKRINFNKSRFHNYLLSTYLQESPCLQDIGTFWNIFLGKGSMNLAKQGVKPHSGDEQAKSESWLLTPSPGLNVSITIYMFSRVARRHDVHYFFWNSTLPPNLSSAREALFQSSIGHADCHAIFMTLFYFSFNPSSLAEAAFQSIDSGPCLPSFCRWTTWNYRYFGLQESSWLREVGRSIVRTNSCWWLFDGLHNNNNSKNYYGFTQFSIAALSWHHNNNNSKITTFITQENSVTTSSGKKWQGDQTKLMAHWCDD